MKVLISILPKDLSDVANFFPKLLGTRHGSCVGVRKPTSSMKFNALSPFFFKGSKGFNKPSLRSGELLFFSIFHSCGRFSALV